MRTPTALNESQTTITIGAHRLHALQRHPPQQLSRPIDYKLVSKHYAEVPEPDLAARFVKANGTKARDHLSNYGAFGKRRSTTA